MAKTSQRVRQARPAKYKTREYSRCRRCGRPRAVYRKFGLCRICLRELVRVTLKYTDDRRPAISGLRRVSRPGQRRYVAANGIPKVQGGMGTTILSTSSGVMTGHEARQQGVGGEVVAEVW